MNSEKVDVIIPAYHPDENFPELLDRLSRQTFPVSRIIVMNTEEKFWNKSWEKEFPLLEVHHLKKEEFDHGGTRKAAAELSDGEYMVFMTQDAIPADRDLIAALLSPLQKEENAGASYARQLPAKDCRFLERYTRSFNYPDISCIKYEKDTAVYGIKTYF